MYLGGLAAVTVKPSKRQKATARAKFDVAALHSVSDISRSQLSYGTYTRFNVREKDGVQRKTHSSNFPWFTQFRLKR